MIDVLSKYGRPTPIYFNNMAKNTNNLLKSSINAKGFWGYKYFQGLQEKKYYNLLYSKFWMKENGPDPTIVELWVEVEWKIGHKQETTNNNTNVLWGI